MAPTTRSSSKPKSETVIEKKSPKTVKKASKTKKPADKKPVKEDITPKEVDVEMENGTEPEVTEEESKITADSIYEFTVKDIDGNEISLEKYRGNVCIIVNVASRCGHTKSNYEQFVELHDKYAESKGLRILAFPCNQFGSQESGTCEKIKAFADNKGVKFDMFDKINVNGKNASPLWQFLKEKLSEVTSGKATGKDIKWNFTKFIVNKDGVPVERYASSTKPLTLVESLEKLW
ncbi:probable phospholipid hydroperoxide glutathione peroxidase [Harmonia axyridis]|uniref:probable phospholipid hydroperoxide glutathione peroxidase n=1 Tax=Harmonia axyridis TaxID=115357 RepID=UPI001E275164|nr:probable phospholipid hydroperoxide glutathione peroxidase [Harmonia axyridis]